MVLTPIGLVHAIAERIRVMVSEIRMEESDGDHILRAPNVWEQNLPEKLYEDAQDPADYPFVLVALGGGTGISEGRMSCQLGVLVGGYDDGQPINDQQVMDRQGWVIPAALAWRIITAFAIDPTEGPFRLDLESLRWELPEQEQPAPQWFGIITMTWTVPVPEQGFQPCEYPDRWDESAVRSGNRR